MLLGRILVPVIVGLHWLANAGVRLLGVWPKDEATSTYLVVVGEDITGAPHVLTPSRPSTTSGTN